MSFFDKIYDQLFNKNSANSNQPLVTEPIERNENERKTYFAWQNKGDYKILLGKTYHAYELKKSKQPSEWQVHLLQMPAANGFALTYQNAIGERQFQHLFDLLKDKTLNLGYKLVNADRSLFDKDKYVETKERYYLKPIIDAQNINELFDQRFGNIMIEQVLIDNKPSYLKFMASIYSDRLYTKALDFEELMEIIFERD